MTVPKAIADRYGLKPGDEIEWVAAGETIRVVPAGRTPGPVDVKLRLKLFDAATERQRRRQAHRGATRAPKDRGWRREDVYRHGRAG